MSRFVYQGSWVFFSFCLFLFLWFRIAWFYPHSWAGNIITKIETWETVHIVGFDPCEKHGPKDSVDKNRGRRPRFLSLLRPEGHVCHTTWRPWSNPIIARSLIDFFPHFMVAREIALLLWTGCQGTQMNNCHENLNTCFTRLNGI